MPKNNHQEMTIAEAKENFAAAMEQLAPAVIIRQYPMKSVAAAAAAGAAAYLTRRRSLRSFMPYFDIADMLFKRFSGIK